MRRKEMSFANCTSRQCVEGSREITRSRTREVGFTLGLSSTVRDLASTLAVIQHPSRGPLGPFGSSSLWEFPRSPFGMLLSGVGLPLV
jgi:hypothetical protein